MLYLVSIISNRINVIFKYPRHFMSDETESIK